MKLLSVVAMTIAIGVSAFGAPKNQGGKAVDQQVLSIEHEMLDAVLKGNVSPSEKYLADDFVGIGPDGGLQNKTEALADVKSGDLKLQNATIDDAKVHAYGDTAIVTYTSQDKGTYKGKDITGTTRWTDVLVKRNGRWQMVASHGTSVAAH